MFFSFLTFSQKYPRIEKDSLGNKFVIMTYEQAQKIDNTFELVNLLEKAGAECDSLSLSYVKVINKLEKQDKEDLINALKDSTIPTPSICIALEKRGHRISIGAINQYRRGEYIHVIG